MRHGSSRRYSRWRRIRHSPLPSPILSRLLVRVGDRAKAGQALYEVEDDIVIMERRAPFDCIVAWINYNEGDRLPSDAEVLKIEPLNE